VGDGPDPHRAFRPAWWWMAALFAAGSVCFLVAPMPWFLRLVGPQTDGAVFFLGSLLFTAAAALQWRATIDAGRSAPGDAPGRRRLAWQARRPDWWSSGLQLAGTLAFNATTLRALDTALGSPSYDRLVWRPDAVGSVLFLASGYVAYVQVSGGALRLPPRTTDGTIAAVNLFGCLAFGVSAVAAFVVPATSSEVDIVLANTATAVGALAFLVGALLLLAEGAPPSEPAAPPDLPPSDGEVSRPAQ
jgi:hypothetical protein